MPTNEIYKFLKDNNLTQKDEASFLKEYSDSAKAKELYGFMQENGLTSKDFNSFYDTYLKKKDGGIPVTTISEDVLKTGFVPQSSVPSSATLSPLEIPRPQGQSEKVRVEAEAVADKQVDPTKLGSFLPQDRTSTPKTDLAATPTQARQTAKLMEEKPLIKERQQVVKKEAFDNTLKAYSKGKKLSQAQLDTKAKELDKMLSEGKLQIAKDPTTGKRILAYKDNNFFTSLWDSAKGVEKHRQKNVEFSKLDLEGKIKMVEEENATEAPYLPEMPSGVGGALGQTVGELVTPLARPIAYGMAGVAAATMANAPAAYSAGASAVGSTIAFVEDMMYSGRAETFKRVYNGLLADNPNPTQQQKIEAAMKADKAAIGGAATGAAEAMLFGMPIAKLAKIEQAAGAYTSKIENLTRHSMVEAPKAAAIMGAGAGARATIAKESGAKDVDVLGEMAEAAKGGVEMVVGFGALKAIPHALTVLGRTVVPPSKSITSQAKAIVSELPREEVIRIYEEGEKQGVFEEGTAKRVSEELKSYDEAKAAVPETVQKSETQDALAGKLEAKFKKEKELAETKIESRKKEIQEEIAQIDKDIDAIYEGKPIEEHEYDVTGKKLSELKPVEFEEQITTEEQLKGERDLPIGVVGYSPYEVREDGVYFRDRKLKNPNNKSRKQLIEDDIESLRQEELDSIKKVPKEKGFIGAVKNLVSPEEYQYEAIFINRDGEKVKTTIYGDTVAELKDLIKQKYDGKLAEVNEQPLVEIGKKTEYKTEKQFKEPLVETVVEIGVPEMEEKPLIWTNQEGIEKTINGRDWIEPVTEWWDNAKSKINEALRLSFKIDVQDSGNWLNATKEQKGKIATRRIGNGRLTLLESGEWVYEHDNGGVKYFDKNGNEKLNLEQESQAIPLQEQQKSQDITLQKEISVDNNATEIFSTKSGKQSVYVKNGELVVESKDGKPVSPQTRKKAIKEYAEVFDFNKGEKAPEPTDIQFRSEEEAKDYVIENSKNPYEIVEVYVNEEPTEAKLSSVERMIAEYGIGKVTGESYNRHGDRNNMNMSKAKTYISKDGIPLDVKAKEMSDYYDVEITPQDLVEFMDRFPSGEKQALREVETDTAIKAVSKFKELTGMDLSNDLAKTIVEKEFNKLSKEQQLIAEQDYETAKQLEDAYWQSYKETNGFTKESPVSETKQAEPAKSIKDKFKDIADINLSDNPEVVKKREVTKYLKDNPEIADVVKNFRKVTDYLEAQGELKKSSPDC